MIFKINLAALNYKIIYLKITIIKLFVSALKFNIQPNFSIAPWYGQITGFKEFSHTKSEINGVGKKARPCLRPCSVSQPVRFKDSVAN